MTNSSSSKKDGQDQHEISGPATKSLRTKMSKPEDSEKKVAYPVLEFRF
uniref:Transcription initiation factor TFIID subunit 14b n=1 Tax=Rhizophora mucronata TaxID=61149 RepID=A0A2P2KQR2_RHIMU